MIKKLNVFKFGNVEGRDHLQGLGVDGSQLKNDLKTEFGKCGSDLFGSKMGTIMGSW